MRTVYLHIGTYKTGTTSIQVSLGAGRSRLEEVGLLFPRTGIPRHDPTGHHNIGLELMGDPGFRSEDGTIDDLLNEIGSSRHDVVVSTESFGSAVHLPDRWRLFLEKLRLHADRIVVVVYLRNQVGYASSLYLQFLRHGYSKTFDAFLTEVIARRTVQTSSTGRFSFCYREVLSLLPRGDGIEIVVRSYDRTAPDGVVSDFFAVLGADPVGICSDRELRENPSLTLSEAVLAFYANRRQITPEARLVDFVEREFGGKSAEMGPLWRHRIIDAFDSSNRFVNAAHADCDLATSSTETPAAAGADKLLMEHVFSEATVLLLDGVTHLCAEIGGLARACDEAVAGRDLATHQLTVAATQREELSARHAAVSAERDRLLIEGEEARKRAIAQRDHLASDRDAWMRAHDQAVADRDAVRRAHDQAVADREAVRRAHDQAVAGREAVLRAHDQAVADREAVRRAHDQAVADHEAVLRSRSWRLTAPLRRMRGLVRPR
jgi:hypothetical protein